MYELIGQRWVDQGTAFCTGGYDSALGAASLVARGETDYKHIILQTRIRGADTYQRQQDTLIVWTEPNGSDYALSFQDPEGCAAVWQFIEDVQQHINPDGPPAPCAWVPVLTQTAQSRTTPRQGSRTQCRQSRPCRSPR